MSFTVSDWKAAFKTDLEGRAGLSSVTIYDAETNTEDLAREHVVLGDWEQNVEYITFRTKEESYVVDGRVSVKKPNTAKAARDRALAILAEVETQLDSDPEGSATVWDALFVGYRAEERVDADNGRVCDIEFQIEVKAHDNP